MQSIGSSIKKNLLKSLLGDSYMSSNLRLGISFLRVQIRNIYFCAEGDDDVPSTPITVGLG